MKSWFRNNVVLHRLLFLYLPLSVGAASQENDALYSKIYQYLDQYCINCHNADKQKGDVDLSDFKSQKHKMEHLEKWQILREQIEDGNMPPKKSKKQPTESQVEEFLVQLDESDYHLQNIAGQLKHPTPVVSRLNATEYNHTIRDLTGVDIRPAEGFPSEGGGTGGFDNQSDVMHLSELMVEKYFEAAHKVSQHVKYNYADGILFDESPVSVTNHQHRQKLLVKNDVMYQKYFSEFEKKYLDPNKSRHEMIVAAIKYALDHGDDSLDALEKLYPKYNPLIVRQWVQFFNKLEFRKYEPWTSWLRAEYDVLSELKEKPTQAQIVSTAKHIETRAKFLASYRRFDQKKLIVYQAKNKREKVVLSLDVFKPSSLNHELYLNIQFRKKRKPIKAVSIPKLISADPKQSGKDLVPDKAGRYKVQLPNLLEIPFPKGSDQIYLTFEIVPSQKQNHIYLYHLHDEIPDKDFRHNEHSHSHAENKIAVKMRGDYIYLRQLWVQEYSQKIWKPYVKGNMAKSDLEILENNKVFSIWVNSSTLYENQKWRKVVLGHLHEFSEKAYRRKLNQSEKQELEQFFLKTYQKSKLLQESIKLSVQRILCSPHFLFRIEEGNERESLNQNDLANRLSYFLWASMPDEKLMNLAEQNKLNDPVVLEQQVKRMLKDKRAASLAENLIGQWLEYRDELPEKELNHDQVENAEALQESFYNEILTYVEDLIRNDQNFMNLINSNYSYVNKTLANHYGLDGEFDDRFKKVEFKKQDRGGLLGMGGFHWLTSYPDRSSPVLRGHWVVTTLLGKSVPPPPDDVVLEDEIQVKKGLTFREKLALHRQKSACISCHQRIDPIGFSLDQYDQLGRFRTHDQGQKIDPTGLTNEKVEIKGLAGLKSYLQTSQSAAFTKKISKMVLSYGLGRKVDLSDQIMLKKMGQDFKESDYKFSSLVLHVVKSEAFLNK